MKNTSDKVGYTEDTINMFNIQQLKVGKWEQKTWRRKLWKKLFKRIFKSWGKSTSQSKDSLCTQTVSKKWPSLMYSEIVSEHKGRA